MEGRTRRARAVLEIVILRTFRSEAAAAELEHVVELRRVVERGAPTPVLLDAVGLEVVAIKGDAQVYLGGAAGVGVGAGPCLWSPHTATTTRR